MPSKMKHTFLLTPQCWAGFQFAVLQHRTVAMPTRVAGFCFYLKMILTVYTGFYFPTKSERKQTNKNSEQQLALMFCLVECNLLVPGGKCCNANYACNSSPHSCPELCPLVVSCGHFYQCQRQRSWTGKLCTLVNYFSTGHPTDW